MANIAIVTGASRGIGYETALALANQAYQVLALARSAQQLETLQAHAPQNIQPFTVDLTQEDEIGDFISAFRSEYGRVDILINNAGTLLNKPFDQLTRQDWHSLLDTNLLSAVMLTKSLLPYFNPHSHIVNISSMGGFQGSSKFPGLSAYSVAKGAVSILSECLAVELAEQDIRVNALCLGAVQTEMLAKAFPGFEAPVRADQMGEYVADFAVNGSTFYNGQILPVTLADPG